MILEYLSLLYDDWILKFTTYVSGYVCMCHGRNEEVHECEHAKLYMCACQHTLAHMSIWMEMGVQAWQDIVATHTHTYIYIYTYIYT